MTIDTAFVDVMGACGDRDEGTWITADLALGFRELHRLGYAHSIEVWNPHTGALAGGLYGLAVGGMFAGESMFHRETDASKVAFSELADRLHRAGFLIFDAQQMTPHLASLGCVGVSRSAFLSALAQATKLEPSFPTE